MKYYYFYDSIGIPTDDSSIFFYNILHPHPILFSIIGFFFFYRDAAYLQKTEKKQYFAYSCYAWGFTMLFLIVALITNFAEGDHWKPGFGEGNCWFNGRTETWIFFYGPIAVLVTSNVILFVLSSYNLWQQTKKYEVNKLNNLKHR